MLAGDLLPLVLPGHDAAVLDSDGDGDDEVSVSAATSIAGQGASSSTATARPISTYSTRAANTPDQGPVLNLADYPSIGDLSGDGTPAVVKGGLTLNGVANLLAVNQNLPFSHVEQAWDPTTGQQLPGFPRATDDFQLLSQPRRSHASPDPGLAPRRSSAPACTSCTPTAPTAPRRRAGRSSPAAGSQATPAVGDADGDGDLDVTALTREGWSFLWDTGVAACGGSNNEWWTFHHDERDTANYGTDARPPGTPTEPRRSATQTAR